MSEEKRVKVEIMADQQKTEANGQIHVITRKEALRKAGIFYAGTLVLTLVCVFIPLVHFVAVPALLLLGPIISIMVMKFFDGKKDIIVDEPHCPSCQGKLKLTEVLESWPLRETCPSCHATYQGHWQYLTNAPARKE